MRKFGISRAKQEGNLQDTQGTRHGVHCQTPSPESGVCPRRHRGKFTRIWSLAHVDREGQRQGRWDARERSGSKSLTSREAKRVSYGNPIFNLQADRREVLQVRVQVGSFCRDRESKAQEIVTDRV